MKFKKKPTAIEIKETLKLLNNGNPTIQKLIDSFNLQIIEIKTTTKKQNNMTKSNFSNVTPKVKTLTKTEVKTEVKTEEKKATIIYPKGIVIFAPHEKAPEFVKGKVIINLNDFQLWLEENNNLIHTHEKYGEQIKLELLEGKDGLYFKVDTYGLV